MEKPAELNFASVRESLMQFVPLCLDSDPSLIPLSCNPVTPRVSSAAAAIMRSSPSSASDLVLESERPSLLDTAPSLQDRYPSSDPQTLLGVDLHIGSTSLSNAATTSASLNRYTDTGTESPTSLKTDTLSLHSDDGDPDDFTFWEEKQAKRICLAIKQVFGVEYAPEVVVADANLTALANRILLSKEILTG